MEARRRALTPLATPRLLLRELRPDDLQAVHAFAGEPSVCRWTDWGPNTLDDTRAFLAEAGAEAGPDRASWTLAVTADDALVGTCGLWVESAAHRRGRLGFVVAPAHQGRGYATEAARALLGLALGPLGLERVEATCRPENTASRRVLEKAGMRLEGRLRSHVLVRGQRRDSLLLAALAPDLPQGPAPG